MDQLRVDRPRGSLPRDKVCRIYRWENTGVCLCTAGNVLHRFKVFTLSPNVYNAPTGSRHAIFCVAKRLRSFQYGFTT